MKPQQIDMRVASQAQRDKIFETVKTLVGEDQSVTPARVKDHVTRELNVALTYDQSAYMLTRARKYLGVKAPRSRSKKTPEAPAVIVTDAPNRIDSDEMLPNQLVDDTVAELRARIRELEQEVTVLRQLRDWVASQIDPAEAQRHLDRTYMRN